MSLIDSPIGPQNYEYVLDRIGEILTDELDNQVRLTYDQDLNVTVYKERFVPFQPDELPAVNVMLFKGSYSDQTQTETQGVYRFIIEVTGSADSEEDARGDTLSMIRVQKLMGKIRAIIENPIYKTLGFQAPRIGYRRFEELEFMKHPHQDANNSSIGRLLLAVQVNETTSLINPVLLASHQTTVRLASTDQGFIWTLEAP